MGAYINSNITIEELANQIDMDPNATDRERHMAKMLEEYSPGDDYRQDEIDELESKIATLEDDVGVQKVENEELQQKVNELEAQIAELKAAEGAQQQ